MSLIEDMAAPGNFQMAVCRLALGTLLACALGILHANVAQARPRDEVMSRAFHCAVIGDSRPWLDCYYGAAQPVRAALGLQPAPSGQLSLVLSPPAGNPTSNDLTIRDQVTSNAIRCNEFTDERQWLDCYYAAAQPMRASLGLAPGPQAAAGPVPYPSGNTAIPKPAPGNNSAANPATFGLPAKSEDRSIDHIDAHMVNYTFDKLGIFTVTLTNGQVWRQLSGDTNNAHWDKSAASYTVSISHGFLGSYNLRVKDNPNMYKVQRVS